MQHIQNNQVMRPSQRRLVRAKSCLMNLISFDKVTCIVGEGKAVGVVCLDFSKSSDTVSHTILLWKLAAHGLDGIYSLLGKNLAGWRTSKSGSEWS